MIKFMRSFTPGFLTLFAIVGFVAAGVTGSKESKDVYALLGFATGSVAAFSGVLSCLLLDSDPEEE
jgi:hypothetical protein